MIGNVPIGRYFELYVLNRSWIDLDFAERDHADAKTDQRDEAEDHAGDQKEIQELIGRAEIIAADHDSHITEISKGVGQIHEIADIALIAGHGQKSLENGGVNGHIGEIKAEAEQDHQRETVLNQALMPANGGDDDKQ